MRREALLDYLDGLLEPAKFKATYKIKAGVNKVKEDFQTGKIKINKSAEDGIISGRKFKITYSYNGKSLSETAKTNAKGIAVFDDLRVG
jgi:hypothetical protein